MDRKLDASMDAIEQAEEEEPFRLKDILLLVTNKGFWVDRSALRIILFGRIPLLEIRYGLDGQ